MIVNNKIEFRSGKQGRYKEYMSPNLSPLIDKKVDLQYNYQDIKRPLKINHSDLSFKGLSFGMYNKLNKVYSRAEFEQFAQKYLDEYAKGLLDNVTVKHKNLTSKLIQVEGDNITIYKKSIPHLALDGILYPFKILPADILNGLVSLAGKIPGLKQWSAKTLERPFFKNIRQRSKIDAKVNSLTSLIIYRDAKVEKEKEILAKQLKKTVDTLTDAEIQQAVQNAESKMESYVFQDGLKQFDLKSGNYDTKHERALNRLVSGLPPAVFLATDAYNLSRMMDDDPKEAKKERNVRFKQETSRILTSGYLTLITMGAFQKFINNSKAGIVLTTGLTVLVTEMFSRLMNGKYITRLTPEQARKINAENSAKSKETSASKDNINTQTSKQPASPTMTCKPKVDNKSQQKPLLSFDTVMKASAVVLALGYGIKGFKNLPFVKKAAMNYFNKLEKPAQLTAEEKLQLPISQKIKRWFDSITDAKYTVDASKLEESNAVETFEQNVLYAPFKKLYNYITTKDYIVRQDEFDSVIRVLEENGFGKLAQKYKKVGSTVATQKEMFVKEALEDGSTARVKKLVDVLDFKSRDKRFVKPLVNFVIAPFRFMWNTVTLPYWLIDEKILPVARLGFNKLFKIAPKVKTTSAVDMEKADLTALVNSYEKLKTQAQKKNFDIDKFKDYIQDNFLKGFNMDSRSNVSNAELSNLAKTAAYVATLWFLMTDNYNMVMLKSNGNDKAGAETKFKERFVQEGSRLFYQTLLIDLFNSTFRNSYNASLWGMTWVTFIDTTLGEILTRSSVGTPVKPHTRDELIAMETEQNNSTGFKKKYYNFMQRLTGKRSIKSYEVASKNTQVQATSIPVVQPNSRVVFKQNNELLSKMING